MYTEEDLRATLDALEHEAPEATGVLAALARARRRRTVRRRVTGVVAAAVVAAVVAGGSVLVGDLAGPSGPGVGLPPAVQHLDALRYPFAVDESAGLEADYADSRLGGVSTAWIGLTGTTSGVRHPYLLEVLQAGRYDPPRAHTGEPVRVNGRDGFYQLDFLYDDIDDRTAGVPGVAWEYAPDAWAVLRYQPAETSHVWPSDVRETLLRIAAAVRFDRTTPVRLPFEVGYLPAGLRPAEDFPADMGAGPNRNSAVVPLESPAGRLSIWLVDLPGGTPPPGEPDVRETSGTTFVKINLGQFGLEVEGKGFPVDEVKRVARSITAADIHDENTWIDAEKALPLH